MNEVQKEKYILEAIKSAMANINLEEEFDLDLQDANVKEVEEKVLRIGGYDVELGRLLYK